MGKKDGHHRKLSIDDRLKLIERIQHYDEMKTFYGDPSENVLEVKSLGTSQSSLFKPLRDKEDMVPEHERKLSNIFLGNDIDDEDRKKNEHT